MTLEEFKVHIETEVGLPVYFEEADKDATLPYIVYREVSSRTINADDFARAIVNTMQLELWTERKDLALERKAEHALAPFPWSRTYTWDAEERVRESIYSFQLI